MIKTILSLSLFGALGMVFLDGTNNAMKYSKKIKRASDLKFLRYTISKNFSCESSLGEKTGLDCSTYSNIEMKNYADDKMQSSDGKMLGYKVTAKCVRNEVRFDISEDPTLKDYLFKQSFKNKCRNYFIDKNALEQKSPFVMAALEVNATKNRDNILKVVYLDNAPPDAFKAKINLEKALPAAAQTGKDCNYDRPTLKSRREEIKLKPCAKTLTLDLIDGDAPFRRQDTNSHKWSRVIGIECNTKNGYYLASCTSLSTGSPDVYIGSRGRGCFTNDLVSRYWPGDESPEEFRHDFFDFKSGILVVSCIKQ